MIKTSIKPIKSMFRVPVSKHWRTALVVLVMAVILVAPMQSVLAVVFCPTGEPVIDLSQCSTGAMPTGIIGKKITEWVVGEIGGIIANSLYYTILVPEGLLLSAAGTFANWMLHSGPITTSTVVTVGWGITRDLANMLFILILLGIALDYILFQSFGVKKALPTLIGVALIINFSLPIAGIFIDFASVFTDFFMGKITAGCGITMEQHCGFTEAIANNLSMTSLFSVDNAGGVKSYGGQTNLITDIIFAIFFMAGTIFIFLALGIMFLLRTGYLYALLILLPLVLALKPLPQTGKYFGQWSSHFIKWTMFAPIASFFLYLSMLIFQANVSTDATKRAGDGIIEQVYTYIIVWFFMLGSLMAAQSMGITGAGVARGMIKGAQNWAGGKIKSGAKKVGGAAARKAGVDTQMNKAAEWASKNKVLSTLGVGRGLRGIASKTEQAIKQQGSLTPQEKATYEKYSSDQLMTEYKDLAKGKLPYSQAKAAQVAEMLTKRGAFNDKDSNGVISVDGTKNLSKEAYAFAKKHSNKDAMKSIRKANPIAYQEIAKKEWDDDKENIIEIKNGKGEIIKTVNKKTGKTLEETQNQAFEEMTSADFENLKGTWTEKTVKSFVASGVMSQGHLRMANNNLDQHFIDYVGKALADTKTMTTLRDKSGNFFNYLKSGGVDSFSLKIPDNVLKEMGEEKETKKSSGEEKPRRQAGFGSPDIK